MFQIAGGIILAFLIFLTLGCVACCFGIVREIVGHNLDKLHRKIYGFYFTSRR